MVDIKLSNYRTLSLKQVLEGENSLSLPVLWFVFRVTMSYIHCKHNEIKPKHSPSHTQAPISTRRVPAPTINRLLHLLQVHTTPNNIKTAGALFSSKVHPSHDSDATFPKGSILSSTIPSKGKSAEASA